MLMRGLGLAIGSLSLVASASAQAPTPPVLTLPPNTTQITPIAGTVTKVQAVRVSRGNAVTGSETRVTMQFKLQGCLDTLLPVIAHPEVLNSRVMIYVTALNAHNEKSDVARCVAIPQATAQVSVPGIFQKNQIRVVFLGQPNQPTLK